MAAAKNGFVFAVVACKITTVVYTTGKNAVVAVAATKAKHVMSAAKNGLVVAAVARKNASIASAAGKKAVVAAATLKVN